MHLRVEFQIVKKNNMDRAGINQLESQNILLRRGGLGLFSKNVFFKKAGTFKNTKSGKFARQHSLVIKNYYKALNEQN